MRSLWQLFGFFIENVKKIQLNVVFDYIDLSYANSTQTLGTPVPNSGRMNIYRKKVLGTLDARLYE